MRFGIALAAATLGYRAGMLSLNAAVPLLAAGVLLSLGVAGALTYHNHAPPSAGVQKIANSRSTTS